MKSESVMSLEDAAWPAIVVDGRGCVRKLNTAAHERFGGIFDSASPALSQIWSEDNAVDALRFLEESIKLPASPAPRRFKLPDGAAETFYTSLCSSPGENDLVLLQLLPLPENPAAESRLGAERQKLDRALQLARTLALDFNNALTGVLGNATLLLAQVEASNPWRNSLVEIERAALRAVEIANDLGTFSRQEKERQAAAGNLSFVVARSMDVVRRNTATMHRIDWELQGEKRLFALTFEENRLQPALIKVLENAAESLGKNRTVAVHTRNVELTEASQDRNARLAPGRYVCVEVKDTGCGIPDDILARVFEPFFTTKHGAHRGLGLALAYGIVTNLGGAMAISSQTGAGTSVRLYLPAQDRFVEVSAMDGPCEGGGQTILVVDDEDILLTTERAILGAHGYTVLSASSGEKALHLLRHKTSEINLVITDLVMPAMSGKELIERMRTDFPATPVICTTGCVWPPGQQPRETEYLHKPFTAQQLIARVQAALLRGAKELD